MLLEPRFRRAIMWCVSTNASNPQMRHLRPRYFRAFSRAVLGLFVPLKCGLREPRRSGEPSATGGAKRCVNSQTLEQNRAVAARRRLTRKVLPQPRQTTAAPRAPQAAGFSLSAREWARFEQAREQ